MECSLLACPFLLHLLGRLLLDLFVVGVSADSEFFHVAFSVIFLVCTYFCYSFVIAFLVGGYEYLYDRFYCRSWMSMKFQFHLFIGFVGCRLADNRCLCC